jgi:hypothetical protein
VANTSSHRVRDQTSFVHQILKPWNMVKPIQGHIT